MVGEHSGALESWVGLFNTYNDLGTWHCVTPYIGGGVGFASISVLGYKDVNAETGRIATYDNANKSGGLVIEDITSHAVMLGVRWKLGKQPAPMRVAFK